MKRYNLFTGNFGSGKTELSIDTALMLTEKGRTTLVDLDVLNPYFKSSTKREELELRGVKVIGPTYSGTAVDVPALPAEVASIFALSDGYVVLDVGGDPNGAKVFGRYKQDFDAVQNELDIYYVINACRPMSATSKQVLKLMGEIEGALRFKVTKLVNNTNIAYETSAAELSYGQQVCEEVSAARNLSIAWVCGLPEVLDEFARATPNFHGELHPLRPRMRPEWLDFIS